MKGNWEKKTQPGEKRLMLGSGEYEEDRQAQKSRRSKSAHWEQESPMDENLEKIEDRSQVTPREEDIVLKVGVLG